MNKTNRIMVQGQSNNNTMQQYKSTVTNKSVYNNSPNKGQENIKLEKKTCGESAKRKIQTHSYVPIYYFF